MPSFLGGAVGIWGSVVLLHEVASAHRILRDLAWRFFGKTAGGLYSTAEDLLRLEQGLFGGKLLSSASLQRMTTPFKNDYACGLAMHTVRGLKLVEHGGGIEGFNIQLSYYPDEKLTVVVLGNLNGSSPGEIASKLAALAHGEKVVLTGERKEIVVPTKILAECVGSYELGPGFVLVVTLEGDQLITHAQGADFC
jgi:CubicO group peptidase (beta-lactamase class C family)